MLLEVISILSLIFGIGGTIFALIQYRSRIRVQALLKSELSVAINRIKTMISYRKYIKKLVDNVEKPELVRWVWEKHKGLCDLYVMMVNHCLSSERKFTYDDLKKLVDNKVISSKWEEKIWRDMISRRPENLNVTIPEYYIS